MTRAESPERAVRAMPTMLTIRQTAATGILPETALRRMRKMGQLPGVEVGERKFLVNYERLVDLLNGTFEGIRDGETTA